MTDRVTDLATAVGRIVEAGDTLHVVGGHWRWTAAATEVARQWWGRPAGFGLVMGSLTSLGAIFARGELVDRVATTYSGDTFPTYTPNPIWADAYRSGRVVPEHWSFLSLVARLRAAAMGEPAAVIHSIGGSSMAEQAAYAEVADPFGGPSPIRLVSPLRPDVAMVHAPIADRSGHVAFHPPMMEGLWGAWAARKGTIVTVERIVDDIRPWRHLVKLLPRHVVAVCEVPFGAHPGGLHVPGLPVDGYGEDIGFWTDIRDACRDVERFDAWIAEWVTGTADHAGWMDQLGEARRNRLRARAAADSWRDDAAAHPPDMSAPVTPAETAAVVGARRLRQRIEATGADVVLAGAGLANLAAWLGVAAARDAGADVRLCAELGMWGYEPTPADPYIFNHRSFPTAEMLADADTILGGVMAGRGFAGRALACLGAAQISEQGDINSTEVPGGAFLVGSGGGNDVVSGAHEAVVVTVASRSRLVPDVGYVTSPGGPVRALATHLGWFERIEGGRLRLAGLVGDATVDDVRAVCGWDVDSDEGELAHEPGPSVDELEALRRWDPVGIFLGRAD